MMKFRETVVPVHVSRNSYNHKVGKLVLAEGLKDMMRH